VLLLQLLKNIESAVGRVSSIRNGPRAIDLDIVLYGDAIIDTRPLSQRTGLDNLMGELVVPHPRMVEREFVLRPINECVFLVKSGEIIVFIMAFLVSFPTSSTRSAKRLFTHYLQTYQKETRPCTKSSHSHATRCLTTILGHTLG
jgi:hypothetical protein